MEQLQEKALPAKLHQAFQEWLTAIRCVHQCRLQERTNVFQPKEPNRLQEDKGGRKCIIFIMPATVYFSIEMRSTPDVFKIILSIMEIISFCFKISFHWLTAYNH